MSLRNKVFASHLRMRSKSWKKWVEKEVEIYTITTSRDLHVYCGFVIQ